MAETPVKSEDKMTTFYLVISSDGLEGSFTREAAAWAYLKELREIGVRCWIEPKRIQESANG